MCAILKSLGSGERVVFAVGTEISKAQAKRNGDFETMQVFEIYEARFQLVYDWRGNK